MTEAPPGKSLKERNRRPLWAVLAVNGAVFYAVAQANSFRDLGFKAILASAADLLPVGIAIVIVSVTNGLVPADVKAKLVFLRRRHALPGHRAFTRYAPSDPRTGLERLRTTLGGDLPTQPERQNDVWYNECFKKVENDPAVLDAHREFLFTRDYATLALLILATFGAASFLLIKDWRLRAGYDGWLIVQLLLARQAAVTYGGRFVCTVLARTTPTQVRREHWRDGDSHH